ncbi:hypothetical protein [Thalassomonas actiniarum]|uniref:Uncharacterized protein n=1 Tax=Thalassomonas actiniarum TaxID=485447 RepID=A0AAF0C6K0_9GAMM|nr:hypothetical protein [Thalassomonas actiniarum]WDE02160.1 hypothetical protein SG35_030865 [Thalassomonas actiniarum]
MKLFFTAFTNLFFIFVVLIVNLQAFNAFEHSLFMAILSIILPYAFLMIRLRSKQKRELHFAYSHRRKGYFPAIHSAVLSCLFFALLIKVINGLHFYDDSYIKYLKITNIRSVKSTEYVDIEDASDRYSVLKPEGYNDFDLMGKVLVVHFNRGLLGFFQIQSIDKITN